MAHINLYLYNPHQASASYPFSRIDISINADANADALCGKGLNWMCHFLATIEAPVKFLRRF